MPHRRPKPSFVLGAVAALAVASPFAVYGLTNDTPDVRSANETSSVAVPTQISQVLLASVPDIVIPLKELTGLDLPDINLGDLKALIPTDIALPPGITIPTELLPAPADPAAPTETPVQDEEFPGAVVKQLTRDAPFSMVALTSDTVDSAQSKIRALSEDGIWGPWFSPDAIDAEQTTKTLSATEPLYVGLTKAIQILTPRDTPATDAAPAPDEIVAHFVDEHDHGQHEQERYQRADDDALGAEQRVENLVQFMPSIISRAGCVVTVPSKRKQPLCRMVGGG